MRVAVIGAGPAGLTAALQLRRSGAEVDVYEAAGCVGGMAQTIDLWGQRVDLGPHRFFSTDARVNRFWLDIVGSDYLLLDRRTRIHYQGERFEYPLRAWNVCRKLGVWETTLSLGSYAGTFICPTVDGAEEVSFESWVVRRFGRRLFQRFFQSYSEKLWGIPCSELSGDFAAQRIRRFSMSEAVRSSLLRKSANSHRTLVDCFAYPLRGTGDVYERIAAQFTALGGRLHLGHSVRRVAIDDQHVTGVQIQDGKFGECDALISTMPLTRLIDGLPAAPDSVRQAAGGLQFRNTILVYLNVDSSTLFDDQWLYIHDPGVRIGRVTNFRNWSPQLYGTATSSVLCAELWCDHADATWVSADGHLIELVTNELRRIDLVTNQRVLAGHVVRVPRCYPVYRIGYRKQVDHIASYLRTIQGLTVIGRYGAFKYNNQDHSILMGLLAADNLLHAAQHNLWDLNSDFEDYQERAVITRSGLTPSTTSAC